MRTPRSPLRFVSAAALAGALVAVPAAARTPGPPAPTAADLAQASKETELANRLFAEGVFETAVTHYQKAYELAHRPSDLKKVGDCRRALGELGRAHDAYERLLSLPRGSLGAQAGVVKKAMTEIEKVTGLLAVHSTPDGAAVRAGGRTLGVTPLAAPVRLPVGRARIEIRKDGYEPLVIHVAIDAAHPAAVDAVLAPRVTTGHLAVREAHDAQAHLLLDGQDMGSLPWQGDVPAGTHELSLQGKLLQAAPQTVRLRAGGAAQVVFVSTSSAGHLRVQTVPSTAGIEVDGEIVGTGQFDGDVAAGDHVVRVSAPGYTAHEEHVAVAAQATQSADVVLQPFVSAQDAAERKAREEAAAYHGAYGEVALFGALALQATHLNAADLPSGSLTPTGSPGFVYGGGLSLRAGYGFGVVGLEGIVLLMGTAWQDQVTYASGGASAGAAQTVENVPHQEQYSWQTFGGLIGVGPRLTTPGRRLRFTAGAGGGLVIESVFLSRSLSNGLEESPRYKDYALVPSPGVTGDIGITVGSTPGASFTIGAMAWAAFPSAAQTQAKSESESASGNTFTATAGPFTAQQGPQVFFGPYLGVRFGH